MKCLPAGFLCRKCGFLVERGIFGGFMDGCGVEWGLLEVKWGLCNCRGLNCVRTEQAD